MHGAGFGQSSNKYQPEAKIERNNVGQDAEKGRPTALLAEPAAGPTSRLGVLSDYIRTIKQRQDAMKTNMSYLDGLRKRIGGLEVEKAKRYQDVVIKEGDQVFIETRPEAANDGSVYSIYQRLYDEEKDKLARGDEMLEQLIIENFWEQQLSDFLNESDPLFDEYRNESFLEQDRNKQLEDQNSESTAKVDAYSYVLFLEAQF